METIATQQVQGDTNLQQKIVDILGQKGPMTRGDMVVQLQTPRTTIYDSIAKLMARNVVDKRPINNGKRGHPKVLFYKKD